MSSQELFLAHDEEPIVALSSGSAPCAIAILRLSGNKCHELILPFLKFAKNGNRPEYGKMALCEFRQAQNGKVLDEPMVVFFKGPRSYTGQDSVELYLHGGTYIIQKAMELLLKNGFRSAEPGEFTRRAYLSGKLDLSQAEGIRELIHANSEHQWLAARQLAGGQLRNKIESLRSKLMESMAWLEARIDFPDEKETSAVEMQEVDSRVNEVAKAIESLRNSYDNGRVAASGLKVALFGKPNAGKSTLMNHLLGTSRALVTPIAGTTRDYLEEPCLINGRLIRLIDTAGIRESDCEIERLGIERSFELAESADIVLFMMAANDDGSTLEQFKTWTQKAGIPKTIAVLSKEDLGTPSWWHSFESQKIVTSFTEQDQKGLRDLQDALASQVDSYIKPLEEEQSFISNTRHKEALDRAYASLERYYQGRKAGAYEEMLAFELLDLTKQLGGVIGKVDSDDILGLVFGSFCVGK
ncbi:MAG: tRNA uridine-5-carboxymethylaminomethyl(34) synthesis GTPase MnmE [Oligoflexales bacterium]|nr:tRNA uridine-5-carboxymethylaminomethyl(34) synthesis GTPase MnmE [Oligoflexales bacterium]